jgi:hypothetical protein
VLLYWPNLSPPPKPHPTARPDLPLLPQAADVGALPIDHALRDDSSCVLCHEMGKATESQTPLPVGN